jgi:hypothetical protein
MLPGDFLAAQLRAGLEKFVSKDTVLVNPSLCALVTADNALPDTALATDPNFLRFHLSEPEIAAACQALSLTLTHAGHIHLPYRVLKHTLELHTTAPEQLLKHWLFTLSGCDTLQLERRPDFFLLHADEANAFALWRTLAVVPFFGEFIEVRMHSEELPMDGHMGAILSPIPAAAGRGVERAATPAPASGRRSNRQKKNQRGQRRTREQFTWVAGD